MRAGAAAATLLMLVLALAGCGEREFAAAEFVAAANEQGAELALGRAVTANDDGEEVFAIEFAPAPGAERNPQLEAGGGSGTMVVASDAARAGAEFDRCETAADLTCFRAANVVLRFEAMEAADRARVTGALTALQSQG